MVWWDNRLPRVEAVVIGALIIAPTTAARSTDCQIRLARRPNEMSTASPSLPQLAIRVQGRLATVAEHTSRLGGGPPRNCPRVTFARSLASRIAEMPTGGSWSTDSIRG